MHFSFSKAQLLAYQILVVLLIARLAEMILKVKPLVQFGLVLFVGLGLALLRLARLHPSPNVDKNKSDGEGDERTIEFTSTATYKLPEEWRYEKTGEKSIALVHLPTKARLDFSFGKVTDPKKIKKQLITTLHKFYEDPKPE